MEEVKQDIESSESPVGGTVFILQDGKQKLANSPENVIIIESNQDIEGVESSENAVLILQDGQQELVGAENVVFVEDVKSEIKGVEAPFEDAVLFLPENEQKMEVEESVEVSEFNSLSNFAVQEHVEDTHSVELSNEFPSVPSNVIEVSHEMDVCEKQNLPVPTDFVSFDKSDVFYSDAQQMCVEETVNSEIHLDENIVGDIQVVSTACISENENSVSSECCSSSVDSSTVDVGIAEEASVRRSSRIAKRKQNGTSQKETVVDSKKETTKKKDNGKDLHTKNNKQDRSPESVPNSGDLSSKHNKVTKPRGRTKSKKSENCRSKGKSSVPNDSPTETVTTSSFASNAVITNTTMEEKCNTKDTLSDSMPKNTAVENKHLHPLSQASQQTLPLSEEQNGMTATSNADADSIRLKSNAEKTDESGNVQTTKIEKVKSRWRRSSELEYFGELNLVTVKNESEDEKPPEQPVTRTDTLTPVVEEVTAVKENIENSPALLAQPEAGESPVFQSIEENVYRFERKKCKTKKEARRMLCDCTLTKDEVEHGVRGCGDDCLNRLLMIECGSRCATGEFCSNKRFQRKQYAPTRPFKTKMKGWGLSLLEDLNVGSFVIEYVGEVLGRHEFKQRVKQYAREKCNHHYFMALKSDEVIDATFMGNVSRFINHSCDPNCETQKWTVNGELRIGFFAKKDIKAGEELTFDYKLMRYGREAQKCYCESENCTGFIGETKSFALEGSSSKVSKKKKAVEDKKRAVFEDLTFDQELEKLCSNGGLRNRDETLILARLMVRAEDASSRFRLLDVILKTCESACLRLFLDYHGLSLIWSWMADVVDPKLKLKILQVLSMLPISNKTMLLDSKVLSVVEKWSSEFVKETSAPLDKNSEDCDSKDAEQDNTPGLDSAVLGEPLCKKVKLSDNDSETDGTTVTVPNEDMNNIEKSSSDSSIGNEGLRESKSDILDQAQSSNNLGSIIKSDDDSLDTLDDYDEKKTDGELLELSGKLLQSWSSLKEVFRIPRIEQQKRHADELEADKQSSDKEFECSSNSQEQKEHESSEKLAVENTEKNYAKTIPVCFLDRSARTRKREAHNASHSRMSKEERRHLFAMEVELKQREAAKTLQSDKADAFSPTKGVDHIQPHNVNMDFGNQQMQSRKVLLPTPLYCETTAPPPTYTDMSTLFQYPPPPIAYPAPAAPQLPFLGAPPPNLSQPPPIIQTNPPSVPVAHGFANSSLSSSAHNLSYSSAGSHELTNISGPATVPGTQGLPNMFGAAHGLPSVPGTNNIVPSVPVSVHGLASVPSQNNAQLYVNTPTPSTVHVPGATVSHTNVLGPSGAQGLAVPGPNNMLHGLPNVPGADSMQGPSNVMGENPSQQPHVIPGISTNIPLTPQSIPISASLSSGHLSQPQMMPPTQPTSVVSSMQPMVFAGQNSLSAENPVATPYRPSTSHFVSNQAPTMHYPYDPTTCSAKVMPELQLPPVSSKPVRLPPNWKTAKDSEGNIYYYHSITRQTQWDPPEGCESDDDDDEDSDTPTYDEPKIKRCNPTTAAADTSFAIKVARKIKELFRTKMSSFVVHCLNAYRKPDCKVGKIQNTEDFKYLARKLTHFVMAKELKHCKNFEKLECNEHVKHKAKEYITKYMLKFGPYYRREEEKGP